jgi:hypothetical protein
MQMTQEQEGRPQQAAPRSDGGDAVQIDEGRVRELQQAILRLVDEADGTSQNERAIAIAEALLTREMFTEGWCTACQATTEGMCADHDRSTDLIDDVRRHLYSRVGVTDIQT